FYWRPEVIHLSVPPWAHYVVRTRAPNQSLESSAGPGHSAGSPCVSCSDSAAAGHVKWPAAASNRRAAHALWHGNEAHYRRWKENRRAPMAAHGPWDDRGI